MMALKRRPLTERQSVKYGVMVAGRRDRGKGAVAIG